MPAAGGVSASDKKKGPDVAGPSEKEIKKAPGVAARGLEVLGEDA
jgi:hypothetical protein